LADPDKEKQAALAYSGSGGRTQRLDSRRYEEVDMSGPVLSIIIVNWNTRNLLRDTLKSVQEETLLSHEVWVVDNGSTDGSQEMVRDEFPDAHLIANTENLDFAAANNQALPLCQGEYILLLNSDTVVLDGALDKMVAFMHGHDEVGALGCKLLNADGSLQPSAHRFYSTARSIVENRVAHMLWPHKHANTPFLSFWDHSSPKQVDWVCGAVLMVRKSIVNEVGLLDDSFFMYGEEIDWQLRMQKAGHQVWYLPSARIIHYGGGSSRQAPTQMKRQEYKSREMFVAKHYSPIEQAVYRAKARAGMAFWQTLGRLRGQPVQVR
jgi:GT2 family glycosyltransferase